MPRKTASRKSGRLKAEASTAQATGGRDARRALRFAGGGACLLLVLGIMAFAFKARQARPGRAQDDASEKPADLYQSRSPGTLTFAKDVAPILLRRCAACHRPGEAAPFSLLTYEQVRMRASQVVEVTAGRLMPPWPPEPGYGDFVDSRRLTGDELGILRQWFAEGAIEGDPADLPAEPIWPTGWKLGTPDLEIKVPEPYRLPAEGKDPYRNFVLPIPLSSPRYVKAVEIQPGNARAVHHAFLNIDETRQSRRLAEKQAPPGFDGMELPGSAVMPAGQFLGWQPGKTLYQVRDGLAWRLSPGTDLVLQMHLHPTGKPEAVQPSIGLYFTDQAPTNVPFRLRLAHYELDIPPNEARYEVEQSYVLPVNVSLLRVNPHAHYLGKDLKGYARLPNGETRPLLWIKDWDFNWQGDYEYSKPVRLPKGTRLVMRFAFDNTTNNVRNPSHPPRRVRHGIESSDEMAALGFQALADTARERQALSDDYQDYFAEVLISYFRFLLRSDPNHPTANSRLAWFLLQKGKADEALEKFTAAIRIDPDDDQAHYGLGYLFLGSQRLDEAQREFLAVVRLNSQDSQAYGNLGLIAMKRRRFEEAEGYLEAALRINPDDEIALKNLRLARELAGRR